MEEKKRGIPKGCLITVAVILGLGLIGIIVGMLYCKDIVMYGLGKGVDVIGEEIKADLPEGYTVEDVDRVIADFKDGIKNDQVDEYELQEIGTMVQSMMEDKVVDQDEALRFLKTLKAAVGTETEVEMETDMETETDVDAEPGDSL